ncbi:MAG: ABC transporter substrate-binding protein [Pseudomonadota bacterium]
MLKVALAPAITASPVSAAERVVAIGGDVTEIIFALGAGDRLIGVDSTSQYPPEAEDLPDIGYMRRLSAEPIVALMPDLVLASGSSQPEVVLRQLENAQLDVVMIPDEPDVRGVVAKIKAVGDALELKAEASELAADIERTVAEIDMALRHVEAHPRVLFLLNIGRGAPLTAGRDTSAASIIALAGGQNAIDGFEGYKPLSQEAAIAAAPEIVLMPTTTLEALGGSAALFERPELRFSPAAANRQVIAMDGLLLLGFGPRLSEAVTKLAQAFHPDLKFGASRP